MKPSNYDCDLFIDWFGVRNHPHIDVGNGAGIKEMFEISHVNVDGNCHDIGYFYNESDRDLAIHAVKMHNKLIDALKVARSTLYDIADAAGDVDEWNEGGHYRESATTVRNALEEDNK